MDLAQIASVTTVLLVADAIWLTSTSASTRQMIAAIQGKPLTIRWIPAAAVYALMIAALWFFAVRPAADWLEGSKPAVVELHSDSQCMDSMI